MHLTLLVIFGIFFRNTFLSESKKVTPDGTVYEGFKGDAFRRITSHLIETNIVNKLGLCSFNCLKNRQCISFNFGNPFNGKHICELLRTDKYNSRSSLVNSTDFHYFFPSPNKCMDPSPCQNNGSCYPDYDNDDYHCVCNGTKGRNCEIYYQDCFKMRTGGYSRDGIYNIDPDGQGFFPVYCDMTNGGWTVFQKRFDGSVDFYRGWQDYKTGFGNLNGEFWLGLDKIRRLSKRRATMLRVDVKDWNENKGYAVYSSFAIADERDFYRLSVSGYSGTAGDSLKISSKYPDRIHNGMQFSTLDRDNDMYSDNCAISEGGGWWYNRCYLTNLNGRYMGNNMDEKAMSWYSLKSDYRSLKRTQMKLK